MCFDKLGLSYLGEELEKNRDVIVHCSATPYEREYDAVDIHGWHLDQGWAGIGYHFVILVDGTIQYGRDMACEGAHASGYNDRVGICLIGGTDDDLVAYDDGYNPDQQKALVILLDCLTPNSIYQHRELPDVNKACACISNPVMDFIRELELG